MKSHTDTQLSVQAESEVSPTGVATSGEARNPSNRLFNIEVAFTGLIKRQTYTYSVVPKGGNHPAVVIPASGTFTASQKTKDLTFNIVFCGNVGECPEDTIGLLDYTDTISNDPVYNSFVIALEADGETIYSDFASVACTGCGFGEDKSTIDIVPSVNFDNLYINDCNHGYFEINNLKKQTTYYYNIEADNSSWPTIVTPASGSFNVYQNTSYRLPITLCSCANTGVCVEGQVEGLLPYNNDLTDYLNNTYKVSDIDVMANHLRATSWSLRLKEDTVDSTGTVAISNVFTGYAAKSDQNYPIITNFTVDQTYKNDGLIKVDFDFHNLDPYMDYELDLSKTDANWYVYSDDVENLKISNNDILLSDHSYKNRPNTGTYQMSVLLNFLDINNSGNANINRSDFNPELNIARSCQLSTRLYAKSDDSDMILYENALVINGLQGPSPIINTVHENNGSYSHIVQTSIKNLKYEISVSKSNWPIIIENATGVVEYNDIRIDNAGFNGNIYNADIKDSITFCVSNNACPPGTNNMVPATESFSVGTDKYMEYNIVLSDIDTDDIFYSSPTTKLSIQGSAQTGPSIEVSSSVSN